MSIYQKVNQTKIGKTLICIHFTLGCLSLINTSRVPVEEKSSVCVICMKYRIIILIIINISLGQKLYRIYIANTSHIHMHVCTHTQILPSPFTLSLFDGSVVLHSDGVNAPFCRFRLRSMASRWFIQINTRAFGCFTPINIARPN